MGSVLDYFQQILSGIYTVFASYPLIALFWSGFLSSTLLPGSSELSLYASLQLGLSVEVVVLVATIGNTLGGVVNYFIGIYLPNRTLQEKRGLKIQSMLQKYGYWILCFSWLPVIGDPLCVAAGWMRMQFLPCLFFIFIGKAVRYILLTFAYLA